MELHLKEQYEDGHKLKWMDDALLAKVFLYSDYLVISGTAIWILPQHTNSAKEKRIAIDHMTHLHLQGFNPDKRVLYKGGELKTVTISATRRQ